MMNIEENNEAHFIKQVELIDKEILGIESRIVDLKANESALNSALKAARVAEHRCTSAYANSPNERTQLALENAREFTIASQKRVSLFCSNEIVLNGDVQMLWQQRKAIIDELSRFRCNRLRPNLEFEAENLIKEISLLSVRYLTLVALLDGQNVLRLDLDSLIVCFNQNHKQDLTDAKRALDSSFEKLTKVDI